MIWATSLRIRVGVTCLLVLGFGTVTVAQVASQPAASEYDCGTLALYTLLKITRRPVDLNRIVASLPSPTAAGYSLLDLRHASKICGLDLIGVRLPNNGRAPNQPTLVFMNEEPHGHYVVVRPVGHTGKLVQVIDPSEAPVVMDAATLYMSPQWTGIGLTYDHTNIINRLAWSFAVSSFLVLILLVCLRRVSKESAIVSSLPHSG